MFYGSKSVESKENYQKRGMKKASMNGAIAKYSNNNKQQKQ